MLDFALETKQKHLLRICFANLFVRFFLTLWSRNNPDLNPTEIPQKNK